MKSLEGLGKWKSHFEDFQFWPPPIVFKNPHFMDLSTYIYIFFFVLHIDTYHCQCEILKYTNPQLEFMFQGQWWIIKSTESSPITKHAPRPRVMTKYIVHMNPN